MPDKKKEQEHIIGRVNGDAKVNEDRQISFFEKYCVFRRT
ncbi:hypothetical protein FACS1894137_19650 [Spirochaetia bacterium]|nr:hypothetical protein FACS1894137_19650 [Spirochaetia bacterium]